MKPLFIIKTSSSDENDVLMNINSPTPSIKLSEKRLRSVSLPDCRYIYKDLTGIIHQSKSRQCRYLHRKSRSFPSSFFLNDQEERRKHFQLNIESFSGSMNFLDATSGLRSPGESSSRYSLYGSFFDLSECGYPIEHQRLTTNTFEEKCTDWLNQIDENPHSQQSRSTNMRSSNENSS